LASGSGVTENAGMYERPPSLDDGTALERVRALCLTLPEAVERPSHGAPTFFVSGKRSFATFVDNHHRDGRLAIWCAAPAGMQAALVESDPEGYFVPPYVGHRGWLGVRLDRGLHWDEIAGVLEDAYAVVAPKRLVDEAAALRAGRGDGGLPPP
jgi:hypothetical protein